MASLPTRTTASFDVIKPVSSLVLLDNEFNQYVGASGIFNGGTTATKLLVKASDASDPPLEIDQIGAGPLAEWKQNGTLKTSIGNSGQIVSAVTTGTAPLDVQSTTKVTNLNADKVDGFDIVGDKTAFSIAFFESDPSAGTFNTEDRAAWICPDGNAVTITKLWVKFTSGSHTPGGSVTFTIRRRSGAGSFVADIGTVTLDNTNNTIHVVYKNDIGDVALNADDSITYFISARSGTVSERSVALGCYGKQSFTT